MATVGEIVAHHLRQAGSFQALDRSLRVRELFCAQDCALEMLEIFGPRSIGLEGGQGLNRIRLLLEIPSYRIARWPRPRYPPRRAPGGIGESAQGEEFTLLAACHELLYATFKISNFVTFLSR